MSVTLQPMKTTSIPEFVNTPLTDFNIQENITKQQEALDQVKSKLGTMYSIFINGQEIRTDETFTSTNPADPSQVIGIFPKATKANVDDAVARAADTFEQWKKTPAEERAATLFRAAEIVRQKRFIFNAWMIFETSKSWVEADADTAEAIDFLEFYGREMLRLAEKQPMTRIPSEDNDLRYIPLGVGAVIPPWNFPFAIMAGMTSASLVAGNTVVLKPASTAPTIAAQFIKVLKEAGLPDGVVNFVTGSGGTVGDALVEHPLTRFIAFTGSREVGIRINELAAKIQPGQKWIKRTILEMGGKDSIVVDETANLDEAAAGIVSSAFGFQGQKCSACSRAIIVESVYEQVLQKVKNLAEKLTIGDVTLSSTQMGAVIDKNAYEKILSYIQIGKNEGEVILDGTPENTVQPGYFIHPTIIAGVAPQARISQEEIFGPVLAVLPAKDFKHALEIANNTEYGLTGSLYSKDRTRIEQAKGDFHVGNLYINRKCTGALVGVHPFGGFNMSGTDSKAGGRDYLLLFTQAKAISEKI